MHPLLMFTTGISRSIDYAFCHRFTSRIALGLLLPKPNTIVVNATIVSKLHHPSRYYNGNSRHFNTTSSVFPFQNVIIHSQCYSSFAVPKKKETDVVAKPLSVFLDSAGTK